MTALARKLLDQALDLPDDERLAIASALLESVEGEVDPGWEEAWVKEAQRRDAMARASGEPLAEWSEVRERVLRRLATR
ncbi:MAG: addiction module protein [Polyangiaceae bacterium]|nr:addiction module protein [Polyangiaceae bacterium]